MHIFEIIKFSFNYHLLSHAELPVFPFPLRLAKALEGVEPVLVFALVSPLHRNLCVLFPSKVTKIGNIEKKKNIISGRNLRESWKR